MRFEYLTTYASLTMNRFKNKDKTTNSKHKKKDFYLFKSEVTKDILIILLKLSINYNNSFF